MAIELMIANLLKVSQTQGRQLGYILGASLDRMTFDYWKTKEPKMNKLLLEISLSFHLRLLFFFSLLIGFVTKS